VSARVRAFTLVELLVSIAISALLVGMLMPALSAARSSATRVACLSNLRQIMVATTIYAHEHDGHLMPALYTNFEADPAVRVAWDFIERFEPGGLVRGPGAMWSGTDGGGVLQCPGFDGPSNWGDGGEPFTGYNYNTSSLGGPTIGPDPSAPRGDGPRTDRAGRPIAASARLEEIGDPSWCVAFGDGGFGDGANKFMRAPFAGDRDSDIGRAGHGAGAQAFRHAGTTAAVMTDGHARAFVDRFTETYPEAAALLTPGVGFLGPGNGVYDLSPGRE
jgi:prepilin-type N-terminal cleavage/methylation domain-containing protein